ncbi:MAG: hypothetical protein IPM10_11630 [Chitinophagaceae bacterium]|nr:hypothetical protein [Chitinophagaceae bacterium]
MSSTIKLPKFCNHCGEGFHSPKDHNEVFVAISATVLPQESKREEKVN